MADADRPDVIVVGGGIGGLGAAFALARKGLRVRVLEQAKEFGEVGAGLQIAPNCTRILHEYGLLDEAVRLGVAPTSMVMRDAVDGTELTRLDLVDLERRYGFPYLVIHRSDLHGILLRGCRDAGVQLWTDQRVVGYRNVPGGARVELADATTQEADLVIAADGLHSVARSLLVDDAPVNSNYVAYRGAVPIEQAAGRDVDLSQVVVYIGPRHHFVHYGLRGGAMLNQVAVFQSPRAVQGEQTWGTPDELDAAFADACDNVRHGIPLMWRDRWWQMFDRDPIMTWVHGRIGLLGDAAHPPLQYLAQGAIMAIEDGWVLAEHVARHRDPFASLDPMMTVGQSIAEPLVVHDSLSEGERRERVASLLRRVGLDPALAPRSPKALSGGQRQRIAIARALALHPQLIICDEPVSALDVSTRSQIVNLIQDIQETDGIAFLFVAHDLSLVHHVSHDIAVMYLGRVVESGPAERVYHSPAHPYTRTLLASILSPSRTGAARPKAPRGEIPSPIAPPSGCRFRTRCPYVMEICATEVPPPVAQPQGGWSACHLENGRPDPSQHPSALAVPA